MHRQKSVGYFAQYSVKLLLRCYSTSRPLNDQTPNKYLLYAISHAFNASLGLNSLIFSQVIVQSFCLSTY